MRRRLLHSHLKAIPIGGSMNREGIGCANRINVGILFQRENMGENHVLGTAVGKVGRQMSEAEMSHLADKGIDGLTDHGGDIPAAKLLRKVAAEENAMPCFHLGDEDGIGDPHMRRADVVHQDVLVLINPPLGGNAEAYAAVIDLRGAGRDDHGTNGIDERLFGHVKINGTVAVIPVDEVGQLNDADGVVSVSMGGENRTQGLHGFAIAKELLGHGGAGIDEINRLADLQHDRATEAIGGGDTVGGADECQFHSITIENAGALPPTPPQALLKRTFRNSQNFL